MIAMVDSWWWDTTADGWFDASHQGKEDGFYNSWERSFAHNMGKIRLTPNEPSPKQKPIAKRLWNIYQQYLADEKRKAEKTNLLSKG